MGQIKLITQTRKMSEQAQQQAMPEQATQIEATAPPAEDVFKGDNWSRQINMKKFPERAQFTIELTTDQIIVKGTTTSERTEYDMKVTQPNNGQRHLNGRRKSSLKLSD